MSEESVALHFAELPQHANCWIVLNDFAVSFSAATRLWEWKRVRVVFSPQGLPAKSLLNSSDGQLQSWGSKRKPALPEKSKAGTSMILADREISGCHGKNRHFRLKRRDCYVILRATHRPKVEAATLRAAVCSCFTFGKAFQSKFHSKTKREPRPKEMVIRCPTGPKSISLQLKSSLLPWK